MTDTHPCHQPTPGLHFVDAHGMVDTLYNQDKAEIDKRLARGDACYGTMAGCALYGGASLTAFDGPVSLVPLYNATDAINNKSVRGLPVVGHAPKHRVSYTDGRVFFMPITLEDAKERATSR